MLLCSTTNSTEQHKPNAIEENPCPFRATGYNLNIQLHSAWTGAIKLGSEFRVNHAESELLTIPKWLNFALNHNYVLNVNLELKSRLDLKFKSRAKWIYSFWTWITRPRETKPCYSVTYNISNQTNKYLAPWFLDFSCVFSFLTNQREISGC